MTLLPNTMILQLVRYAILLLANKGKAPQLEEVVSIGGLGIYLLIFTSKYPLLHNQYNWVGHWVRHSDMYLYLI